jgi:hypothetical protein
MKIKISVGKASAIATLADTQSAKEFYNQLPLRVTMKDFASREKIYVLPKKLSGAKISAQSLKSGDVAYFKPWGNIAFFYDGEEMSTEDLEIIGKFESGKEILNIPGQIEVSIEKIPSEK